MFAPKCSKSWITELAEKLSAAYGVRASVFSHDNGWKITMPTMNGWRPTWMMMICEGITAIELH
jgi:hypothetical protein